MRLDGLRCRCGFRDPATRRATGRSESRWRPEAVARLAVRARRGARRGALAAALALWGLLTAPALAGICAVPGTHASIQTAIDDAGCARIDLAAQTYDESIHLPRPLTLAGPGAGGALIAGLVQVAGGGAVVSLVELTVRNGCPLGALRVYGGARVTGANLRVERSEGLPCPPSWIFEDGFESGSTSAWSTTVS